MVPTAGIGGAVMDREEIQATVTAVIEYYCDGTYPDGIKDDTCLTDGINARGLINALTNAICARQGAK